MGLKDAIKKHKNTVTPTELDYFSVKSLHKSANDAKKILDDKNASAGLKNKMLIILNKCTAAELKITNFYKKEYNKANHGLVNGKKLLEMRMVDIYTLKGKTVKNKTKDSFGNGVGVAGWVRDNKQTILTTAVAAIGVAGLDMILNATIGKNIVSGLCALFTKMWGVSPAGATIMTAAAVIAGATALISYYGNQHQKNLANKAKIRDFKAQNNLRDLGIEEEKDGELKQTSNPQVTKSHDEAVNELLEGFRNGSIDAKKATLPKGATPAQRAAFKEAKEKFEIEQENEEIHKQFKADVNANVNDFLKDLLDGTLSQADAEKMISTGADLSGKPLSPVQIAAINRAKAQYKAEMSESKKAK